MSRYDWLLFLHVLSAFSLVAALVLVTFLAFIGRRLDRPSEIIRMFRVSRVSDVLFVIGSIGTIVLGIWLAIDLDEYQLWDGWIIAALVLWAVAMGIGGRVGKHYNGIRDRARAAFSEGRDEPSPELNAALRSSTGLVLHFVTFALVVVLLIDMIYKPGA
jgi:uncharacterized membrane protein